MIFFKLEPGVRGGAAALQGLQPPIVRPRPGGAAVQAGPSSKLLLSILLQTTDIVQLLGRDRPDISDSLPGKPL